MTDDQVNVTVDPPIFMFAHLVGENAGGVVVLRISSGAGWAADILPTFSSISAARYPALFDADEDFVRHAGVHSDAANVRGVGWRRKSPLVVIRQSAECGQLAKRAASVFTDINGGRQRTNVNFVATRRMDRHRPDIAESDAAGRHPFPAVAAVFADVNLCQGRGIEAPGISRVLRDFAQSLTFKSAVHNFQLIRTPIPAAANKFVSGEKKHLQRFHDSYSLFYYLPVEAIPNSCCARLR